MDRIVINETRFGEAVAQLAGTTYNPKYDRNIVRTRDWELMGGVIFTNYTGESVVIHQASVNRHWINRDMIFCTFDYPFNQLGVKRMFGQVPENKPHVVEMNRRMGFKPVARIEGVFRHNIACIVMCMEKEDCRLLDIKPSAAIKFN